MLQLLKLMIQTQPLILRLLVHSRPLFGGEDLVRGNPWHHAKKTWHAAKCAGWDTTGQNSNITSTWSDENGPTPDNSAAAALAWHADYVDTYLYNPLWWATGGWGRFKAALLDQADLVKLHFDDTSSTRQIQLLWARYLGGMVAGLLWAAERDDVGAARNIVGAGLHALQDFYSHSNWVDDPKRRKLTWPEAGPQAGASSDPRDALHLYTGAYVQPTQTAFKPHGKFAFDCAIMRRLVPADLMDLACAGLSPLSNTALCRRWEECQGAASPRPEKVLNIPIPENVFYVEPPGIALDNTWLSKIAVQQRDLPDRGQPTASGDTMFKCALSLAERHSFAWLNDLDAEMSRAGYESFWQRVKTDRRTGDRGIPGPPELASMLGRYNGDLEQYEDARRMPFTFMSAGNYPPNPDGSDEGWFLRLEISTAAETDAGTDADIYADIDGKSFLLDHMRERTPEGGIGENRLLEYNDLEAGTTNTYVVGPFAQRPQQLVLRNSAASTRDVLGALWEDFIDVLSDILDALGDFLLSLIGGHADYVGADKRTWSWDDLERISMTGRNNPDAPIFAKHSGKVLDVAGVSTDNRARIQQWDWGGGDNQQFQFEPVGGGYHRIVAKHSGKVVDVSGPSGANAAAIHQWDWWDGDNQKWRLDGFTLHMDGGDAGIYDVSCTISAEPIPTGIRAYITLKTLYCIEESTVEPGIVFNTSDEPFVVALVTSPASGQKISHRTTGIKDVDRGEQRDITQEIVIDVPRYGGLILAAQVWESDIETIEERDRIRDDFARGFDERTINERSAFLDALGRAILPDWKVGTLDAYTFKRGKVVEVAHLVTNRQLNTWVEADQSLAVPLNGTNLLSLREIARNNLGLTGGFSVVRDIFGVAQIVGTQSLRAKLESLRR